MHTTTVKYNAGTITAEAFVAYKDSLKNKPIVIVTHDWSGRNAFACEKAKKLAELGFVGFALDMFGNAQSGDNNDEKSALIQPLMQNRAELLTRIKAAVETAQKLTNISLNKIAAIGFCFGGLCVLDLARSGVEIAGVVSFHGLLSEPDLPKHSITCKVLALHGHDDPMVAPETVLAFQTEMTQKKADWQMHIYGHTMHAFTNPVANDKDFGTVYAAKADERSWQALINFLGECFV